MTGQPLPALPRPPAGDLSEKSLTEALLSTPEGHLGEEEPHSASSTSSTSSTSSSVPPSPPPYVEPSSLPRRLTVQLVRDCAAVFKPLKPLNFSRLRWTLLWLLLCLAFPALPLYLPLIASIRLTFLVVCSSLLFNLAVWVTCLSLSALCLYRVYMAMETDWKSMYPSTFPLSHLLILPIYKDDMEVVERTLESVAAQTEAHRVVVNIAWESRTPDIEGRTARIVQRFSHKVGLLHFTVHPYGEAHEIASKAANANYGLRHTVLRVLAEESEVKVSELMVTTCDSDTLFPPRYFEALTADFYRMKTRCDPALHSTVWQAPLLYNWNLHLSCVFVRVTALLRTAMTAGLLIPFSVNPMSCFSFSLECAVRGGFWHPQVNPQHAPCSFTCPL